MKLLLFFLVVWSDILLATDSQISFYQEAALPKTTFAKAVNQLKTSLEKSGDSVRVIQFSKLVKEQGGKNFPDYSILLGCNSKNNYLVIRKDPVLVSLLPCSVVVYDAGRGKIIVE